TPDNRANGAPPPGPPSRPRPVKPTPPPSSGSGRRLRALLPAKLPWPTAPEPVDELVRSHRSIHPSGDPSLLSRAYSIAEQMHRGQTRKSGDPYITHPLAVAQILADLGMDTITLVAALLHDTVEDTSYPLQSLTDAFG